MYTIEATCIIYLFELFNRRIFPEALNTDATVKAIKLYKNKR